MTTMSWILMVIRGAEFGGYRDKINTTHRSQSYTMNHWGRIALDILTLGGEWSPPLSLGLVPRPQLLTRINSLVSQLGLVHAFATM